MHAYLISGGTESERNQKAESLAQSFKSTLFEYEIKKIDDVRELEKQTNLKINQRTTILLPNIEQSSEESQNALLKAIEEPQSNIQFLLTTQNKRHVLPTIVSRCQIVTIHTRSDSIDTAEINNFFQLSQGEQLNKINTIKDRDTAIAFMEDIIAYLRVNLIDATNDKKIPSHQLRTASNTYSYLTKNGNVNLQLSNFVIQINS